MKRKFRGSVPGAGFTIAAAAGFAIWTLSPFVVAHREAWHVGLYYVPMLVVCGAAAAFLLRVPIWILYCGCVVGQAAYMAIVLGNGDWPWWFGAFWLLPYTLPFALGAWIVVQVREKP